MSGGQLPPHSPALSRLIDFLIRYRTLLLVGALLSSLLAIIPANRLTFDHSIESLFPADDPHLKSFLESQASFGGDEFILVAYADPQLMNPEGQQRLRTFADQLSELPGVDSDRVQSFSRVLSQSRLPFMVRRKQLLFDFAKGVLLGDDQTTTAIVVPLADHAKSKVTTNQAIEGIRRLAGAQSFPTYVVGEPVLLNDMFQYAQEDGRRMGWASSALLALVILFFLRSIRWVVFPFIIVQVTIFWTQASLVLCGLQLSMVSSIMNALVTTIGVSTVVYMCLYYTKLRGHLDRTTALRQMLLILGIDVFWVSVTTAAGFAAQFSSHIYPVQTFGLMMVLSSMLVLLAMAAILPAGILFGREPAHLPHGMGEKSLDRFLKNLTAAVLRYPGRVLLLGLPFVLFGAAGLPRLQVETDFSRNFRSSSPIVRSLDFVETRLGGAGTWEVSFPAPAELTAEFIDQVRTLTTDLRKIETEHGSPLTKVISITDGIDLVPEIPFLFLTGWKAQLRTLKTLQSDFVPSLYNPKTGRMRIVLRAKERVSSQGKQQLIARVEEVARRQFPEAKATGLYVLLTFLIGGLVADQWVDLLIGIIGIVGTMTIAYRSLWLGFIALLPNLLPILLVIGTMGWLDIPVNVGTAMIAGDTMGLTVHDSIFYMSAFQRARHAGLGFDAALQETQSDVGRPLVYSNVALVLGFMILATSHFIPVVHFGILVSIAIIGGLAGNVILLPLLLKIREPKSKSLGGPDS
ncbi:MAG: MMPL family transporter [Planctomycetales bacterium]